VATTGGLDLGEVTHFPPTLTLKYRWTNFGQVEPYVGAGVNYTAFIDDEPPAGMTIDYDESFGLAVQAGFDYRIDEHWGVNFDVRYVDISTDVTINNSIQDSVDINPWIISTSVAYRF
jgi:outer membrane protein